MSPLSIIHTIYKSVIKSTLNMFLNIFHFCEKLVLPCIFLGRKFSVCHYLLDSLLRIVNQALWLAHSNHILFPGSSNFNRVWIRFSKFPHKSFYPGISLLATLTEQGLFGKILIATLLPVAYDFQCIWHVFFNVIKTSWIYMNDIIFPCTDFFSHNCNLLLIWGL